MFWRSTTCKTHSARRTTSIDLLGLSFPTHGKTRCLCTTFYTEELGVHQALHSPKVTPGDVGSIEFDLHQISNTDLPGRKSKPATYEQSTLFCVWNLGDLKISQWGQILGTTRPTHPLQPAFGKCSGTWVSDAFVRNLLAQGSVLQHLSWADMCFFFVRWNHDAGQRPSRRSEETGRRLKTVLMGSSSPNILLFQVEKKRRGKKRVRKVCSISWPRTVQVQHLGQHAAGLLLSPFQRHGRRLSLHWTGTQIPQHGWVDWWQAPNFVLKW